MMLATPSLLTEVKSDAIGRVLRGPEISDLVGCMKAEVAMLGISAVNGIMEKPADFLQDSSMTNANRGHLIAAARYQVFLDVMEELRGQKFVFKQVAVSIP